MVWRNAIQLEQTHTDAGFREAFSDLYALREFLCECVVPRGYRPPPALASGVRLTSAGERQERHILEGGAGISADEARLAVFLVFFHHDLFVDVAATDGRAIQAILNDEIRAGTLRYPWIYDRLLYDRFFDMFPTQTSELTHDETIRLLAGTPQGVFQLKDFVVGPLGLLRSSCHRLLEPLREAALWHCSDPSCGGIHIVSLASGQTTVSRAVALLKERCTTEEGPPSEWDRVLSAFIETPDYYDDMYPGLLPWLLVNGFGQAELQAIVKQIVEGYPEELRDALASAGVLSMSDLDFGDLSRADCFQLALLVPDDTLGGCIESCVEEGCITLPPTETRSAGIAPVVGHHGWFDVMWQCSRFGIRAVSANSDLSVLRLKRLIRLTYKGDREFTQLEWKLRHVEGESTFEKLDRFVGAAEPRAAIRELVLSSPDRLQSAFHLLRYGRFSMPSTPEEESRLVEKILWKLGFDIPMYPEDQPLFWQRLERLLKAARTGTDYNESDKESIRSAAANLFVSLEQILDHSLSFSTWALLSDHYGETRFALDFDSARRLMASRLSGRKAASGRKLTFDPGGRNTLYPLVAGFACLAELCAQLLSESRDAWKRPQSELPGYHLRTDVQAFPFLHKALLLDLRETDRERILELLHETSRALHSCAVADIRNRMQHKRPDFPAQDEIEPACSTVSDVVTKLEHSGLSPLLYLPARAESDEFRRRRVSVRDYRGRELQIQQSAEFDLCGLPSLYRPSIVVPWMRLGDSPVPVRFAYQESSEYARMWENYPRRRGRAVSANGEQPAVVEGGTNRL